MPAHHASTTLELGIPLTHRGAVRTHRPPLTGFQIAKDRVDGIDASPSGDHHLHSGSNTVMECADDTLRGTLGKQQCAVNVQGDHDFGRIAGK